MIEVKIEETEGLRIGTIWFRVLISGDGQETRERVLEKSEQLMGVVKKVLEPEIITAKVYAVAPGGDKTFSFLIDCPSLKKDRAKEIIQEIIEAQEPVP